MLSDTPRNIYRTGVFRRIQLPYPALMAQSKPETKRSNEQIARRAAALCLDFKANDVVVLDLTSLTDMTDYFIVASGTSDTHVRSVAERVMEQMKAEGSPVYHVEGLQQGRWVLLDFVDFVVHLFHPKLREFYQLERLWSDAPVVALDSQGALR